ncbi:MAG: hypothetical protein JSS03_06095, partial [Proteobacteria bacterium]|nr:hypothetical protein [Pseudomonadota bacterium]
MGIRLAQEGRFAEALPLLAVANRQAPADLAILHTFAQLLQRAGRGDEAAERYRLAAATLPHEPSVLAGWARATLLIGDQHGAIDRLRDLLGLDAAAEAAHGYLHA